MFLIYDTKNATWNSVALKQLSPGSIALIGDHVQAIAKNLFLRLVGHDKFLAYRLDSVGMRSTLLDLAAINNGDAEAIAILRPAFARAYYGNARPLNTACDLTFRPEATQQLWLVFDLSRDLAYLFAVNPEDPTTLYMPGIPNTWEYGALCTGGAPIPNAAEIAELGMEEWVNKWISAWGASPFNSDLLQEFQASKTLRFDPDTLENILIGDDWMDTYKRITTTRQSDSIVRETIKTVFDYIGGVR